MQLAFCYLRAENSPSAYSVEQPLKTEGEEYRKNKLNFSLRPLVVHSQPAGMELLHPAWWSSKRYLHFSPGTAVDRRRHDARYPRRFLQRRPALVHPAAREGLPTAFLEASSYEMAILAFLDPDGYTSRFGRLVLLY